MDAIITSTSYNLQFTQIAWVIKDINTAKGLFQNMIGVSNFSETVTTNLKEYDGTYYGEPSEAVNLVAMAYSGGIFIELIQPLSGNSIFMDYIDNNPSRWGSACRLHYKHYKARQSYYQF